jgi:hypothetical protein
LDIQDFVIVQKEGEGFKFESSFIRNLEEIEGVFNILDEKFKKDGIFYDTLYDHEELEMLRHPLIKEHAILLRINDDKLTNFIIVYPN